MCASGRIKDSREKTGRDVRNKRTEGDTGDIKAIDHVLEAKANICRTENKGVFFKKCPGTQGYLCCNYYILNLQTNCTYDCQYCILQSYINNGRLNIYTNISRAFAEVEAILHRHPEKTYRIGTGELTDSLSIDHITQTTKALIPFFMHRENAVLELKTKSNNIKNLLKFKPGENIVVSWSLNPQEIVDQYETGTVSLKKRLEAARTCMQRGYRIGIHLDPVILYERWEDGYRNLTEEIFKYISPGEIAWISVAGLRYTPELKRIILSRFPHTKLFLGEMLKCTDGKYRYIRPVRVNAYKKIIQWIRKYGPDVPVYFCMESPAVWRNVFGALPQDIKNLRTIFMD